MNSELAWSSIKIKLGNFTFDLPLEEHNQEIYLYLSDLYYDYCCDECDRIVHTHFNCPVCNTKYAGTSVYGYIAYVAEFNCEECLSEFKNILVQEDQMIFKLKNKS